MRKWKKPEIEIFELYKETKENNFHSVKLTKDYVDGKGSGLANTYSILTGRLFIPDYHLWLRQIREENAAKSQNN